MLEPKAIDILKAASSRLAAARSMSFTAVIGYESPSRLGPPLVYTTKSEVTLQRPDKLRVITSGDGPASEFYYDGKTMMAFAPAENLVAVAEAPPTIDAALKAAYDSAAIYFPFTDMIVADPYKDIADGLKLAFYIGQSHVVGGTTTDMVAYRQRRRVRADLDRRRRQAAAEGPRGVPRRSVATAPPDGALQLATRPASRRTPSRRRAPPARRASSSPARTRSSRRVKPPAKGKPSKTRGNPSKTGK